MAAISKAIKKEDSQNEDTQDESTPRDVNLPARLSARDSALLVATVEAQNPPNEDLKRAAEQFRQRYS